MTDNGNLPSHLTAWLHRLSADEPVADVQPPMKSLSREVADCLRHAAECYVRAGGHAGAGRDRANWLSMACTMFEQIGDHSRAAAGREQLGQ